MTDQQTMTFDLADVLGQLWRRKLLIAGASVAGFAVAAAVALLLPQAFQADGQIVVRAEASIASDQEHSFYSSVVNDAVVTTERDVLVAKGLLARLAGSVTFPNGYDRPSWLEARMEELTISLGVTPAASDPTQTARISKAQRHAAISRAVSTVADKGSSVITVRATTNDGQFSAEIVNRLLTLYVQDRLADQRRAAHYVEVALRERLQQTKEDIGHVEERLAALLQDPHLLENAEIPSAARELTLVGTRLAAARGELAAHRAAYEAAAKLRDAARGNPMKLVEMLDQGSQSTSNLRQQFTESQQQLNRLSAQEGPNHPQRIAVQNAMDGLVGQLSGEAQRLIAQRQAEVRSAEQVVETLTKQYSDLRQKSSQISPTLLSADRERDSLTNLRKIAGTIEDRLIAVVAQPIDANARILTEAEVPVRAAFPNKLLFSVSGFLVGMVLSSSAALAHAHMKQRRSVISKAEVLLGRLLGSVPYMRRKGSKADALAAIFQGIALEVEEVCNRDGLRVLAITSGLPKEGKTTVAVDLAVALSKIGKHVLLINCDLHHTSETRPHRRGDSYPGQGGVGTIPGVVATSTTGFHILPVCNRPRGDPVLYLRSPEFAEVIRATRNKYDIVLCDTPPILSVPDALVVARASDAVLLVSEYRHMVNRTMLEDITRRVLGSGRTICGVVVTKVMGSDISFMSYSGYNQHRSTRSIQSALASRVL